MLRELLIENKELVLRIYVLVIFLIPWLVAMIWHFRFTNGIRGEMGSKFWFTIFPNQEVAKMVGESARLSSLKQKRNFWFLITLGVWLVGAIVFVLLLGWLNEKL
jgi:hypothetical protein